jgi:hypothetical protein
MSPGEGLGDIGRRQQHAQSSGSCQIASTLLNWQLMGIFGWVGRRLNKDELTLVTASDTSHARSLENLLASIERHEPDARVVVFDLGMTVIELAHLKSRFGYKFRTFDFQKYPPFLDIRVAAGEYAWKPQLVRDVAGEAREIVCWMDAGNMITEPLRLLRRETRRAGYYCPRSPGTIGEWTHPGMLAYFGLPANWKAGLPNLNGACVAFDMRTRHGTKLVHEWAEHALIRECIAPPGSSRANHRQDQALLTVLAYRAGRRHHGRKSTRQLLGFKIQQDVEA